MAQDVHPVDQFLPFPKLLTLGLQHVLVMYAGAVAVPLILGGALKLPPEDVAFLISADLFACGLATLVQCVGFPGVGIRLPVMMGVTFASVGPMLSMAHAPDVGLARHLRFGDFGRRFRCHRRSVHGAAVAAVSAGGHRHDHFGHRHFADAGRHQLGRRRPADLDQSRRRRAGGLPQPRLRPARGPRHRAVRAGGHSRTAALVHRLRRQRRGAARHHRRRGAGVAAWGDAFRSCRRLPPGSTWSSRSGSVRRNFIWSRSSPCAS